MGHKINPISLRLQVNKKWPARWFFAGKGEGSHTGRYFYHRYLAEDEAIRKVIREKIGQAGIASVEIERTTNNLRVLIRAARPGFVIGQGGKGIEDLSRAIERDLRKIRAGYKAKASSALSVNVEELKRTEVSAAYVAQQIAWDLERRMTFRRTIKKYVEQIMQNRDVKGTKIMVSGRLDGAEIARTESMKQGPLPLQTLRANIDYARATAITTYGTIGVKVWIYKGEVFETKQAENSKEKNGRSETRGNRYR
ncbi:MAG: 30S ribosomal protein S3 [Candidatus Liptonbacteria bacterium]